MTINDRIRLLRKDQTLNQKQFAASLGVTQSGVSYMEQNGSTVSDSSIKAICSVYNINETWLRTGEEEMFGSEHTFNLEEYIRRRGATDLEVEIIKAYFDLPPDMRGELLRHFQERPTMSTPTPAFAAKQTAAPDAGKHERTRPDIASELAELKRQNQELAAKVAAMEEEDISNGLWDGLSASPSASAGKFSPTAKK